MANQDSIHVSVGDLSLVGTYSFGVGEDEEALVSLPGVSGHLRFVLADFAGSGTPTMDWVVESGLSVIIKHIGHTQYMILGSPACVASSDEDPSVGYWIQGFAVPDRKKRSVFINLSVFTGPPPEPDDSE